MDDMRVARSFFLTAGTIKVFDEYREWKNGNWGGLKPHHCMNVTMALHIDCYVEWKITFDMNVI